MRSGDSDSFVPCARPRKRTRPTPLFEVKSGHSSQYVTREIRAGTAHPQGATWDGAGSTSACSRPTPRESSCACSMNPDDTRSSGSSCRNSPTKSGMATWKVWAPARCTAIASTGRTSRKPATGSTPTSCCSIRLRGRMSDRSSGTMRVSATRSVPRTPICRSTTRDSAPFVPKSVVVDPRSTGAARRAVPARALGRDHRLRAARRAAIRSGGPICPSRARHLCRPRQPAGHRLHQVARRHQRRTDAGAPLRERSPSPRARADELLGLQQHRVSSRPTRATSPTPPTACANSARWCRASTTPGSK